jgi:hypothetical protein
MTYSASLISQSDMRYTSSFSLIYVSIMSIGPSLVSTRLHRLLKVPYADFYPT